jgi:hypothetical protein
MARKRYKPEEMSSCEQFCPVSLWQLSLLLRALRTTTSFRSRPRNVAGLSRNGRRRRASVCDRRCRVRKFAPRLKVECALWKNAEKAGRLEALL